MHRRPDELVQELLAQNVAEHEEHLRDVAEADENFAAVRTSEHHEVVAMFQDVSKQR